MNLEMKSIKHFASGSHETYCYTAVVYLDGKPFADVSNDGHGGSDYVHPHDKTTYTKVKGAWRKKYDEIEEYFASLPKVDVGKYQWSPEGFDQKFEYWCADQVSNFLTKKDMKRRLNRCVVAQIKEDGELKVVEWNKPKGKPDWLLKEHIKKEYTDITILNDLPEADALDIWRTV
jgi:hypothetical protein